MSNPLSLATPDKDLPIPDDAWQVLDLDAASPGEWLASVALAAEFGPGRWRHIEAESWTGRAPFEFQYASRLPWVSELSDKLALVFDAGRRQHGSDHPRPAGPRNRWLNHRGQGTRYRTASDLSEALNDMTDGPVVFDRRDRERTLNVAAWEIDSAWARPGNDYPDPGRPIAVTALAFIGAWVVGNWRGHWPTPSLAVGHLWEGTDPSVHDLDCWVMTWRRVGEPNGYTAGPLGDPNWFRLKPPRWQHHLVRHLAVTGDDVAGFDEVCDLFEVDDKQTQKRFSEAAKEGKHFRVGDGPAGPVIPPPVGKVGRSGLVWDRAAVQAYWEMPRPNPESTWPASALPYAPAPPKP